VASARKLQHVQSKTSTSQLPKGAVLPFSQTRLPHSSTLQVGEKAHFASKTIILLSLATPPKEPCCYCSAGLPVTCQTWLQAPSCWMLCEWWLLLGPSTTQLSVTLLTNSVSVNLQPPPAQEP
jgi:hypothetical protein